MSVDYIYLYTSVAISNTHSSFFLLLGLLFPYWFVKAIIIWKISILCLLHALQIFFTSFPYSYNFFVVLLTTLCNISFPLWFWCFVLNYTKTQVCSYRNIYLNVPSSFYLLCLKSLACLACFQALSGIKLIDGSRPEILYNLTASEDKNIVVIMLLDSWLSVWI